MEQATITYYKSPSNNRYWTIQLDHVVSNCDSSSSGAVCFNVAQISNVSVCRERRAESTGECYHDNIHSPNCSIGSTMYHIKRIVVPSSIATTCTHAVQECLTEYTARQTQNLPPWKFPYWWMWNPCRPGVSPTTSPVITALDDMFCTTKNQNKCTVHTLVEYDGHTRRHTAAGTHTSVDTDGQDSTAHTGSDDAS